MYVFRRLNDLPQQAKPIISFNPLRILQLDRYTRDSFNRRTCSFLSIVYEQSAWRVELIKFEAACALERRMKDCLSANDPSSIYTIYTIQKLVKLRLFMYVMTTLLLIFKIVIWHRL